MGMVCMGKRMLFRMLGENVKYCTTVYTYFSCAERVIGHDTD